jgi:hypothetical protein
VTDAERYRVLHRFFAALTPARQREFLDALGIDYFETAPLSKVIDAELEK